MPSVSRAQQKAMHAAAAGHSTIGIPQGVGADFSAADHARGPTKLPEHVKKGKSISVSGERLPKKADDFSTAMKGHGVAKGDGSHKRHPSTSHFGMGPKGNRYSKR
jgi:hypothetical protein